MTATQIRQLSQRERDMLWWTAEGKTTKEIALILGLSDRTVRFYIENAMTKLRCHSKAQMIPRRCALGFSETLAAILPKPALPFEIRTDTKVHRQHSNFARAF